MAGVFKESALSQPPMAGPQSNDDDALLGLLIESGRILALKNVSLKQTCSFMPTPFEPPRRCCVAGFRVRQPSPRAKHARRWDQPKVHCAAAGIFRCDRLDAPAGRYAVCCVRFDADGNLVSLATHVEVTGVWWLPWSSKPWTRRQGAWWVRFPSTSATPGSGWTNAGARRQ